MSDMERPNRPNAALIQGLRDLADWIEQHGIAFPEYKRLVILNHFPSKDAMPAVARAAGGFVKAGNDDYFWLTRSFGPVALDFNWPRREVCTRRVVGTEDVPEQVTPAHTREIVEWDCHPLLAAVPEAS